MRAPSKMAYLARRNPSLSREQFVRRWRQHMALAMGLQRWDSIARYAQCDVLTAPPGVAATPGWDGIGLIWFRHSAPGAEQDRQTMRADEREVFAAYVDDVRLMLDERARVGDDGPTKASLFAVRSPARLPADVKPSALVRGWARSAVISAGGRLPFTAVDEFWFDSTDDLRAYFADSESNPLADATLDRQRSVLLVTNELVMYDFPCDL